jgi:esterase/lipase superfamily enzyme
MLFMVTNRRIRNGQYEDEEQTRHKFDYLYDHENLGSGKDKFKNKGKKAFEISMLKELNNLRDNQNISRPRIGIYIHGYNNNYQESIDELFDLENKLSGVLGYKPVLIGFSWPSSGRFTHYLSDREEVRDSVPAFTKFLVDANEFITRNAPHCFAHSFLIAHSMGNYLLRKGMEYLSEDLGWPSERNIFNEIIMIAPDIEAEAIEKNGKGRHIAQLSRRVHVYYSKHDDIILASRIKHLFENRLGRHGAEDYENLARNIVVINAKKYANENKISKLKTRSGSEVSVHSSYKYEPNILKDIANVLSGIDRDEIPKREKIVDSDYKFRHNHYRLI